LINDNTLISCKRAEISVIHRRRQNEKKSKREKKAKKWFKHVWFLRQSKRIVNVVAALSVFASQWNTVKCSIKFQNVSDSFLALL